MVNVYLFKSCMAIPKAAIKLKDFQKPFLAKGFLLKVQESGRHGVLATLK